MTAPGIDALRNVPLFAACTDDQLQRLHAGMERVEVSAGARLTTQGSPSDRFHVVLEGSLLVEVDGRARQSLDPGDFFGEISVIDRGPATATVSAAADSVLLSMSHSAFMEHVKQDDQLLSQVLVTMGRRLRDDRDA